MFDQLFTVAIPGILGAASTGVPLYIALRKAVSEMKTSTAMLSSQLEESKQKLEESKQKLVLELEEKKTSNVTKQRIDTEAEWKRVIDEKNGELVRLRAKDDEQELKLADLLNKHIECQKTEARNDERLKNYERTTTEQSKQIRALTTKLLQLDKLVRGSHASVNQGGSRANEALLGLEGDEEEEAGSGPSGDLRVPGSPEVPRSVKDESGPAAGTH